MRRSFNSWDRQAWFWQEGGVTHMKPDIMRIQRNLILNKDYQYGSTNSDWSIDHDDASSWLVTPLNPSKIFRVLFGSSLSMSCATFTLLGLSGGVNPDKVLLDQYRVWAYLWWSSQGCMGYWTAVEGT